MYIFGVKCSVQVRYGTKPIEPFALSDSIQKLAELVLMYFFFVNWFSWQQCVLSL